MSKADKQPKILVKPAPHNRKAFATWSRRYPTIRTKDPTTFAVPGPLFRAIPENVLFEATIDGQPYVPKGKTSKPAAKVVKAPTVRKGKAAKPTAAVEPKSPAKPAAKASPARPKPVARPKPAPAPAPKPAKAAAKPQPAPAPEPRPAPKPAPAPEPEPAPALAAAADDTAGMVDEIEAIAAELETNSETSVITEPAPRPAEPEPEMLSCEECGRTYATARGWKRHMSRTHGVTGN